MYTTLASNQWSCSLVHFFVLISISFYLAYICVCILLIAKYASKTTMMNPLFSFVAKQSVVSINKCIMIKTPFEQQEISDYVRFCANAKLKGGARLTLLF